MLRVLDLIALCAVIGALAGSISVMRRRSAADENYYPCDGAILWLLAGGISCVLLVALQLPLILMAPISVSCFGGYYALGFWYVKAHRHKVLRKLASTPGKAPGPVGAVRRLVGPRRPAS